MGSPVQGGNGGVEPPWRDLFDNRTDSNSEGEEADVDQRITDHVSSVFSSHPESGIPQASPSSEMSSDLPERLEASLHSKGFFKSLLQRIQRAVLRIWSLRSKAPHDECTSSYRALFEDTEIRETLVSEAQSVPPPARGCLASIRQFFLDTLRKMCSCIYKKKSASLINFCGLDPESPEGTIAIALLLRMASKWTLTEFSSLEQQPQTSQDQHAFLLQDAEDSFKIMTIFQKLIQGRSTGDSLTVIRGIAKLACSVSSYQGDYQKAVQSLSKRDYKRDYSEILLGAKQLDILASKGIEEQMTLKHMMMSLCVTYNQLLGEFLSLWGDAIQNNPTGVRYDFVVQVVEANLPILQEAYVLNPQLYERMLDDAICHFFFVPQVNEN